MAMPGQKLLELFKPVMAANGINPADFSDDYIVRAIDMVKSRANFVNDLWNRLRSSSQNPPVMRKKTSANAGKRIHPHK